MNEKVLHQWNGKAKQQGFQTLHLLGALECMFRGSAFVSLPYPHLNPRRALRPAATDDGGPARLRASLGGGALPTARPAAVSSRPVVALRDLARQR